MGWGSLGCIRRIKYYGSLACSYDGQATRTQTLDAGYRLTSQTFGNNLARTLTYGRLDNLRTSDNVAGKSSLQMSYTYAADNRLVTATISTDNDPATYRYACPPRRNAFGRRIIREHENGSNVTLSAYLWWGNQEVPEHKHQAGQTTIQNACAPRRNLWAHPTALNTLYARAVDGSKFKIQYYHKNYLDHVYAVSDDNANILEHYRYNAFGQVEIYTPTGTRLTTAAIANYITWNTRRTDPLTGYHYYLYRHHGRRPSRDPITERGGVNLLASINNDPYNGVDFLGLTDKGEAIDLVKDALASGILPPGLAEALTVAENSGYFMRMAQCLKKRRLLMRANMSNKKEDRKAAEKIQKVFIKYCSKQYRVIYGNEEVCNGIDVYSSLIKSLSGMALRKYRSLVSISMVLSLVSCNLKHNPSNLGAFPEISISTLEEDGRTREYPLPNSGFASINARAGDVALLVREGIVQGLDIYSKHGTQKSKAFNVYIEKDGNKSLVAKAADHIIIQRVEATHTIRERIKP